MSVIGPIVDACKCGEKVEKGDARQELIFDWELKTFYRMCGKCLNTKENQK